MTLPPLAPVHCRSCATTDGADTPEHATKCTKSLHEKVEQTPSEEIATVEGGWSNETPDPETSDPNRPHHDGPP
eukprot:2468041-Prymnesium_polylepis.1